MLHRKYAVKLSLLAYRLLLFLYPIHFRKQFGEDMLAAFEDWLDDECRQEPCSLAQVWVIVLWELPLTAAHEHADRVRRCSTSELIRYTSLAARVFALVVVPLVAWQVTLKFAMPWEEQLPLWLGLVGLAWGAVATQGRGMRCLLSATMGGVVGFGIGLLYGIFLHPPVGDWFGGIATLFALVAVAALIGATYVRVIVEGLRIESRTSRWVPLI